MDGDGTGESADESVGGEPQATQSERGEPEQGEPEPEYVGRSALAAVLLNLTGVGLGYAYLRRPLRATACAVITVLMVVVAFTNDAASTPWLWRILAAAWVAGTAFDAWWLARFVPRPRTRLQRLRPVAVGLVAVAAVVAGHIGYAEGARATFAAGLDAQGRADCGAANRAFDTVTGPFELTLSRDVPAAAQGRAECTAFLAAESAERAGAHADAAAGYREFRSEYPASLLDPFALESTRRVLLAWAGALRDSGDLGGAIDRYRELLGELDGDPRMPQVREDLAATYVARAGEARQAMAPAVGQERVDGLRAAMVDLLLVGEELPDTPTAAGVPQAVLDTFAEANNAPAEGRFCDALPVLDYAVTLPAVAGVATVAHGDRARSLSECGLVNFTSGDLTGATTRFGTLVAEYPDDPGVAKARSALIAAEVGRNVSVPLPLPAPIDAPGSAPVVVYNATSTDVRVLITGPTAHEISLDACPGCPAVYDGVESCPGAEGKPSVTLQMRPGPYYLLQDRSDGTRDDSVEEPFTVTSTGGTLCVTVSRGES